MVNVNVPMCKKPAQPVSGEELPHLGKIVVKHHIKQGVTAFIAVIRLARKDSRHLTQAVRPFENIRENLILVI